MVFNVVDVKYRYLAPIEIHLYVFAGKESIRERPDIYLVFFSIDNYFVYLFRKLIPQYPLKQAKVPVYEAWGSVLSCIVLYRLPL